MLHSLLSVLMPFNMLSAISISKASPEVHRLHLVSPRGTAHHQHMGSHVLICRPGCAVQRKEAYIRLSLGALRACKEACNMVRHPPRQPLSVTHRPACPSAGWQGSCGRRRPASRAWPSLQPSQQSLSPLQLPPAPSSSMAAAARCSSRHASPRTCLDVDPNSRMCLPGSWSLSACLSLRALPAMLSLKLPLVYVMIQGQTAGCHPRGSIVHVVAARAVPRANLACRGLHSQALQSAAHSQGLLSYKRGLGSPCSSLADPADDDAGVPAGPQRPAEEGSCSPAGSWARCGAAVRC